MCALSAEPCKYAPLLLACGKGNAAAPKVLPLRRTLPRAQGLKHKDNLADADTSSDEGEDGADEDEPRVASSRNASQTEPRELRRTIGPSTFRVLVQRSAIAALGEEQSAAAVGVLAAMSAACSDAGAERDFCALLRAATLPAPLAAALDDAPSTSAAAHVPAYRQRVVAFLELLQAAGARVRSALPAHHGPEGAESDCIASSDTLDGMAALVPESKLLHEALRSHGWADRGPVQRSQCVRLQPILRVICSAIEERWSLATAWADVQPADALAVAREQRRHLGKAIRGCSCFPLLALDALACQQHMSFNQQLLEHAPAHASPLCLACKLYLLLNGCFRMQLRGMRVRISSITRLSVNA